MPSAVRTPRQIWRINHLLWPGFLTALALTMSLTYPQLASIAGSMRHGDVDMRAIGVVLGAASYFSGAWLASRAIALALWSGRARRRQPAPLFLEQLTTAVLFMAALVATIALVFDGSVAGAAAASSVLIAIVGFALRNVIADVFAGIALSLEGTYRIGDWIQIENGPTGRVVEITWRSTRIETREQVHAIVPNGRIAQQRVTNYSAPYSHYRDEIRLTIDHETPIARAKTVLMAAVRDTAGILSDPPPDVRACRYEQCGITYVIRYWISGFVREIECRDAVYSAIDAALRENAIPPPRIRYEAWNTPETPRLSAVQ